MEKRLIWKLAEQTVGEFLLVPACGAGLSGFTATTLSNEQKYVSYLCFCLTLAFTFVFAFVCFDRSSLCHGALLYLSAAGHFVRF